MALLSLADSCRLLVIDVKTLRRWLGLAHLSVQAHPLDARLKCLTSEHIEYLATIHHRALSASSALLFPAPSAAASTSSEENQASVWSSVEAEVSGPISVLTQQLSSLQMQVLSLQQQLTSLSEQLQEKLQRRTSNLPLSSLEASAQSSQEREGTTASIDRRKHPRVLPLVEYGAQGTYVIVSPEEGLLSFEPDSPEWFAWLSTLPSFRFVGKGGHFTAFRGYQSTAHRSWWAHRQIHSHSQRRRLGLTTSVTIACLELAASSLQALVL